MARPLAFGRVSGSDDRVKPIDFGIARKAGERRLTFGKLSNVMGTPDYISPEQVRSGRSDVRSDLYAPGAMLYEMLTGETPFAGPNPFAIVNARLNRIAPSAREIVPELPLGLDLIISEAPERDPDRRYASALELAHGLGHQERGVPADRSEPGGEPSKRQAPGRLFLRLGAARVTVRSAKVRLTPAMVARGLAPSVAAARPGVAGTPVLYAEPW